MSQYKPMLDALRPLTEKEFKKKNEQELKDLQSTVNYLALHYGYSEHSVSVIGNLMIRLIQLQGPLK